MEKETMNIAVLGLGIIGSIWAKNLIADGHNLRCWNGTPAPDTGSTGALCTP